MAPVSTGAAPPPQPSTLSNLRAASASASITDANWTLHSRHEPIRRTGTQIAYDSAHSVVVLFGGQICQGAGCFPVSDTWTFDGTNWQQQHPMTSPPARYLGSATYDTKNRKVVLFGGIACTDADCTATVAANDTWTWDGSNWSQESPALSPLPRYLSAMTYNSDSGQVLLYGGCLIESCVSAGGDLWSWNGTSWSLIDANAAPGPRYAAQFAYDALHKNIVLFSGALPQSTNFFVTVPDADDTWTFDGSSWTQQSPANKPEPREGGGMVWDTARQRIILFGGYSDQEPLYKDAFRQDAWTWDGSNWSEQTTSTQPLRSYYVGFVYDDALGKAVFVGGDSFIIPDYLKDIGAGFIVFEKQTWLLDVNGWTVHPDAEPNDRSGAQMAYDAATQQVIL
ncbi:MAG TPA: hypothetical protein VEP30_10040, partial [Chthoniobacterales bacterium]|nr:hypothetical protein [Chthoniobacterales bacterium]